MAHTLYHRTLRVSATVVACMLLAVSGVVPGTETMGRYASKSVAQVIGVGASVAPNEYNTITAELARRAAELDAREREIDARALDTSTSFELREYILSGILILLLCLIVLNYLFDYLRARRTFA